jgi:hypothetical protein
MQLSDECLLNLTTGFSTDPFAQPKALQNVLNVTVALLLADDESGQDAVDGEYF